MIQMHTFITETINIGVIGDACFGQCGFNLDNPFNIKFN